MDARVSCAEMRSWSPERRTVPSTIASTPSSRPMSRGVTPVLPRKAYDDVRDATESDGTLPSAVASSSRIPSAK
ncbi:MAG TPA: hypothetical protein VNS10_22610 [Gemmatimonadaceae bacterium]|nr:hypothetical protein [Gemmatimonadaceae bacterium]